MASPRSYVVSVSVVSQDRTKGPEFMLQANDKTRTWIQSAYEPLPPLSFLVSLEYARKKTGANSRTIPWCAPPQIHDALDQLHGHRPRDHSLEATTLEQHYLMQTQFDPLIPFDIFWTWKKRKRMDKFICFIQLIVSKVVSVINITLFINDFTFLFHTSWKLCHQHSPHQTGHVLGP